MKKNKTLKIDKFLIKVKNKLFNWINKLKNYRWKLKIVTGKSMKKIDIIFN